MGARPEAGFVTVLVIPGSMDAGIGDDEGCHLDHYQRVGGGGRTHLCHCHRS